MSDAERIPEVIAKEIVIAMINKAAVTSPKLLTDFVCDSYDAVLKQVVKSIKSY